MDSQLKQMTPEQLAFLLATIDLDFQKAPINTWQRFETEVPHAERGRYFKLAHGLQHFLEPSTAEQTAQLYHRIDMIQMALPHLLNGADDQIHIGRERLACELIALLEKERQIVGIDEAVAVTTKVAVVMVNDGVKCVEPFNPEIEDEQAIRNRHVQDQRTIFKQRRPDANWADHPFEVGHVHVHIHDLTQKR